MDERKAGNTADVSSSRGQNFTNSRFNENLQNNTGKNYEKYFSPENIERFAPMAALFPFIMMILGIVFSILRKILGFMAYRISFMWAVVKMVFLLQKLVNVLLILGAFGAIGGLIYVVVKFKDSSKVAAWIPSFAVFLSVLSCIGICFRWNVFAWIFGIAAAVFGFEFLARIVIAKKPMDSAMDFGAAVAVYKQYYNDYKGKQSQKPKSQKAEYAAPVSTAWMQQPVNRMQSSADVSGDSYFDGGGLELLGYYLLFILVSMLTCGIAAPWMICKIYSWKAQHTVINGKRLTFTGSGASLLGHWILWEILTVITCGIYSFFAHAALRRWELSNTYMAGEQVMINEKASYFDGGSLAYFGYNLLSTLLLGITCGLSFPWVMAMMQRWETKHEVINHRRLAFDGSGLGFLGEFLIILLLSVVTCGIYLPWGAVRWLKYVIRHTNFVH